MTILFIVFLCAAGGYLAHCQRYYLFLHPIRACRRLLMRGPEDGAYSPLRALCLALAGVLGVGNITGVAAAIMLGGPGALFWMWISALCTVPIKYAEVVLAVRTRKSCIGPDGSREYRGGPMRYLPLLRGGRLAAGAFCVLCIAASFLQGNLLQGGAALSCGMHLTGMSPWMAAAVLAVLSGILIFGGRRRISGFCTYMIPLMSAVYLVMGVTVLVWNAPRLPGIIEDIVRSAWSFGAAGCGGGAGILLAMRHGCAKGVFSHEAGCGTAPIAHAGAETNDAPRQGILGAAEVVFDTLLLCTVTGLVLLVGGYGYAPGAADYTAVVLDAFSAQLGAGAAAVLGISIVLYAFAALVCWSFYGAECVRYLGGGTRARRIYLLLYTACVLGCGMGRPEDLWAMSDAVTVSMTLLNTAGVVLLWRRFSEKERDALQIQQKALQKRRKIPKKA